RGGAKEYSGAGLWGVCSGVEALEPRQKAALSIERREEAVRVLSALTAPVLLLRPRPATAAPEGQLTIAAHVSLAPAWFDPAETPGVITPFLTLYALHDALVKPMPGNAFAPSLAESWPASTDGLPHESV